MGASCTSLTLYHIQFKKLREKLVLGDSSTKLHLFCRSCFTPILAQQCYDMPCHIIGQCQNHQLIATHISSTTKNIYTNNSTMQTRVHWKVFIFLKSLPNSNSQRFAANINRTSLAAKTQRSHSCPNPRILIIKVLRL